MNVTWLMIMAANVSLATDNPSDGGAKKDLEAARDLESGFRDARRKGIP